MNRPEGSQATQRELLATCVAAAVGAAAIIRERAIDPAKIVWEEKSPVDFVSEVDRAAEESIIAVVAERHPGVPVLGEELSPGHQSTSELTFVVDPLDGTTNFLHGFPHYAVSIAAMIGGEPVAGAVLNVPTGELFTASAGGGARRSGQPMHVSSITTPVRALLGTGFPFKNLELVEPYLRQFAAVLRMTSGIRRPGSAALDLADVACGRFDAFWELKLAPWDVAAGLLLVREAGGVVTDLSGTPAPVGHGSIVAGNPQMHAWLLDVLGSVGKAG